jgi:SAM-dependent methyltransferase
MHRPPLPTSSRDATAIDNVKLQLWRIDQASRGSGENWRPVPCTELSPLRRFFDLQAGSIWNDLAAVLSEVSGTIVDVGCGAQPYRSLLPKGVTYIGIDTVEAKSAFGYETPDTRYYDGHTWPLEDGCVDTVLATETLEHVPDPRQFIHEALRALRPGGSLVLTVPFAARWHFIPHDYWRFTPAGFSRILGEAGFADVAVYARGNAVTVAAYKCLALLAVLLLPQTASRLKALGLRAVGLPFLPLFVMLAIAGNLSLRSAGGDDCIGYTVLARKP